MSAADILTLAAAPPMAMPVESLNSLTLDSQSTTLNSTNSPVTMTPLPDPLVATPVESNPSTLDSQSTSLNSTSTPVTLLPDPFVLDVDYHPSLATHAERNSDLFVQPIRKNAKVSDAQKASRLLRRKVEQEEHQQLIEAFDALLQRHSQEQEELATKFSVKPEYLEKLKGTSKHFKVKRSVNIENAKIHKKSVEINEGIILYILLILARSHS